MSAEETVLFNLFDSYWFEHGVFTAKPPFPTVNNTTSVPQVQEQAGQAPAAADKPKLNRITTLIRKSYSDQFLSSKDTSCSSNSPSPKSVLLGPHLQTILSGKEVQIFHNSSSKAEEQEISINMNDTTDTLIQRAFPTEPKKNRNRMRRKNSSRSLSELEFEELKGFTDLGFVFSDEDNMDSRLVSIIPGLQRKGKTLEESASPVSRPYLSEAWDSLEDQKRRKNSLMDWRIPAAGNEMELKDHLRFWAHTVASTVR